MQCSSYSYLNYTLINFRLSILSCAWSSLTANCLSLMEASSGFHSRWFILQTVLLVIINFITSLLFVATAAIQYFPAGYPSKPYCTCYTPPFWSEAHTYVKWLMLLATSWVWEREDSGRAKREPRLSFSLPDPACRPPNFSIVSTDRELEQATLMRSVILFFHSTGHSR